VIKEHHRPRHVVLRSSDRANAAQVLLLLSLQLAWSDATIVISSSFWVSLCVSNPSSRQKRDRFSVVLEDVAAVQPGSFDRYSLGGINCCHCERDPAASLSKWLLRAELVDRRYLNRPNLW